MVMNRFKELEKFSRMLSLSILNRHFVLFLLNRLLTPLNKLESKRTIRLLRLTPPIILLLLLQRACRVLQIAAEISSSHVAGAGGFFGGAVVEVGGVAAPFDAVFVAVEGDLECAVLEDDVAAGDADVEAALAAEDPDLIN
jgi:hypothetical protein